MMVPGFYEQADERMKSKSEILILKIRNKSRYCIR